MARVGTVKAAGAVLLLVLVIITTMISSSDAAEPAAMTNRCGGRASPTGLTQCVAECGSQVTPCLLNCYGAPVADVGADPSLLPVWLLVCTNEAMLCASGCSNAAA